MPVWKFKYKFISNSGIVLNTTTQSHSNQKYFVTCIEIKKPPDLFADYKYNHETNQVALKNIKY